MRYIHYVLLLLALVCFFEVYYLHRQLSFIDQPYLYAGVVFFITFLGIQYKQTKS